MARHPWPTRDHHFLGILRGLASEEALRGWWRWQPNRQWHAAHSKLVVARTNNGLATGILVSAPSSLVCCADRLVSTPKCLVSMASILVSAAGGTDMWLPPLAASSFFYLSYSSSRGAAVRDRVTRPFQVLFRSALLRHGRKTEGQVEDEGRGEQWHPSSGSAKRRRQTCGAEPPHSVVGGRRAARRGSSERRRGECLTLVDRGFARGASRHRRLRVAGPAGGEKRQREGAAWHPNRFQAKRSDEACLEHPFRSAGGWCVDSGVSLCRCAAALHAPATADQPLGLKMALVIFGRKCRELK
jgi:hypothetical protein